MRLLWQHTVSTRRFYKKGPLLFVKRQIRSLQKLAGAAFLFALLFLFLSNPFTALHSLQNLPYTIARLPESRQKWRENILSVLQSIPEFLAVFPSELEKQSFAFFDWSAEQFADLKVFAKGEQLTDSEAGPSAVPDLQAEPTVDPATLPFFIEIKKLNLYEKVLPNVSANNEKEYTAALKEGVAHAKGSAFPGQGKLIYIFGHSTDYSWNVSTYNAVFYQVKDLQAGDLITLYLGEQRFDYRVSKTEVVASKDVDYVNNKQAEDMLLLQTCWPPGTSWKRIFVQALPISADEAAVLEAEAAPRSASPSSALIQ